MSNFDDDAYEQLAELLGEDFLEYYFDTIAQIVDERGVLIASYHVRQLNGNGETIIIPTAEEEQFQYVVKQIYIEAYQKALSILSNEE